MPQEHGRKREEQRSRMDPEHEFVFHCSPGLSCYTRCCQDVTIALTPYDVLRLKRGLGISSDEFLEKYTIILPRKERLIPLVILKMNEANKRCPFVKKEGCAVYEDRPWPCRMYPLDMHDDGTFHLITDSTHCLGLKEKDNWRIYEWLLEQGIVPFDEMNRAFSEITMPLRAQEMNVDNPAIGQMVFMALYNIDKFREFVFNSTFLDRFDVDPVRVLKIQRSDDELLKLSFDWIKFGIFGQKLFSVKQDPSEMKPSNPVDPGPTQVKT